MNKLAAVAAVLSLVLAGCNNTHVYKKGGADVHTTQADLMACEDKLNPHTLTGDDATEAMDKCMAEKGYEKQVDKYRL